MDEGNEQGSGLSWSGLITVLLLFAGAVLVQQLPLHSSRPTEAAPLLRLFKNPQVAEARLWEDPFGAVARHEPSTKDQKSDSPTTPDGGNSFCNPSEDHGSAPSTVPTDILGVMVFGGDYEERREKRRRMRYAMVSGLLAAGLSPKDQEHIGYFQLPRVEAADAGTPGLRNAANQEAAERPEPSYIPFEWFQNTDRWNESGKSSARSVLLLWLDEYVYRERPLERLAFAVGEVRRKFQVDCKRPPAGVKIIGPASSSTLAAIYGEAGEFRRVAVNAKSGAADLTRFAKRSVPPQWVSETAVPSTREMQSGQSPWERLSTLAGVEFFSATATAEIPGAAPEADLLNAPGGPQLIRVTSTDKALMKSILGELELRGLNQACRYPRGCRSGEALYDHIALISEWDTEYGRSLPRALIDAQHERCHARASLALPKDKCDSDEWVHLFSYLAGIDGTLPGAPHSDKSEDKKNSNGKSNGAQPQKMEHADGDSAYDYLRRLGSSLMKTHQHLQRDGGKGIRAIGILGSDVYDKLLVLQALRPHFPEALFFTTDLDARYLHTEEYAWTRNLIVASHFGLEPSHSLQAPWSFPPFRDSYQTATFLAARLALQGTIEPDIDRLCPPFAGMLDGSAHRGRSLEQLRDVLASLWQPRIFEVGRTQAVDLSPRRGSEADPGAPSAVSTLCLGSDTIAGLFPREGDGKEGTTQRRSRRIGGIYPEPSDWISERSKEVVVGSSALGVLALMCFLLVGKVRAECCTLIQLLLQQPKRHPWRSLGVTLLAGIALIAATVAIRGDLAEGEVEPFYWTEGISTWPTDLIRLFAVLVSGYFLFKAAASVHQSQRLITEHYFHGQRTDVKHEPESVPASQSASARYAKILRQPWKNLDETGSNWAVWREYVAAGKRTQRIYRVTLLSALHLLFGFILTKLLGGIPPAPFRGRASELIDCVLLISGVVLLVVLIFLVIDMTRLCIQWVRQTMKAKGWPDSTTRKYSDLLNLKPEWLDEWIDVQVIAEHTEAIQRLIYYPFIIFFLMILARSTLFDNWRTPIALLIIFLINLGYAVFCAYFLRSAVEGARQKAIGSLSDRLINVKGSADEDAKRAADQLEVLIDRIKTMRTGVFAPFTQQPLVRAVLVPISGYGGITLIEYGLRYFR